MAFIFDTIILLAFTSVFVTIALFQLLAQAGFEAIGDPPDSAFYTAWAIIAAVIPFWLAFNVWLYLWRGQTVGKYIVGIRIARSDGGRLGVVDAFSRLLVLNPLLFHPVMIVPWVLLAVFGASLTLNAVVAVVAGTLAVLSLVAAPVALVAVLLDKERRALHDRVAGTLVVQPA